MSVSLNLGDAPYLDEIFDAQSPQHQSGDVFATGSGASSPQQAPDPVKQVCSGYELLLHLYGVVHAGMTLPAPIVATEPPREKSLFIAFAPRERIDRPPEDRLPVA